MSVLFTWWWLALPMLILPLWWHRQRRQQDSAQSLATARFLPASDPRLQSVWRWRQILLLLLRLLMLLCLLALIAGIFYRGRSDTIFVSRLADKSWVQQQLNEVNKQSSLPWSAAKVVEFCPETECEIASDNILHWLALHQHEWQANSRWLVLADPAATRMSAIEPDFQQSIELRVEPNTVKQRTTHAETVNVLVKSSRYPEWQAWFKAFEQSLDGRIKFELREQLEKSFKLPIELVIWESPLAPAAELNARLWWIRDQSTFSERGKDLDTNESVKAFGITVFDTKQGRVWLLSEKHDWPLHDLLQAKRLFEFWRSVQAQRQTFPAQSLRLPAKPQLAGSTAEQIAEHMREQKPNLDMVWIWALIALFCAERMVNHARRP